MSVPRAEEVDLETVSREEEKSIKLSRVKKKSLVARYLYGIIFLVTNLCAWFVRDYVQRVLPDLGLIKSCGVGGYDCLHTMGVLRVSFGTFIFFFLMFVTTFSTSKVNQISNTWHSGWWTFKFLLLVVSMVVPFFAPPICIQIYGELARIGAGTFLVLQLVSVIEFITWWNNYWMPDERKQSSCSWGLLMSTVVYIGSGCGMVLMYYMYAWKLACSLNIFFISWTLVLLIVILAISLHSKVNRGLLSSGIMASYLVFLCWSAIRSEPTNGKCNARKQYGYSDWSTIVSFLIGICAIVMATFSTGIDSKSFQFSKEQGESEEDVPYGYGFFHMVFSLGAMYFAMLFISWNLENSARKWSIDVGWASTWVKIVNEWFAATVYIWKLISPVVRRRTAVNDEQSIEQIYIISLP